MIYEKNDNYRFVREIINHHDPIGLLEGGAPEDEYSVEISAINSMIGKYSSVSEMSQEIYQLFIKKFDAGLVGDRMKYNLIAEDIMKLKA